MELTLDEKGFALHAVAGLAMGVVSAFLGSGPYVGVMAVALLYVVWYGFKRAMKIASDDKEHGTRWWLGIGVWPYITLWLFAWAIVHYALGG